MQRPNGWNDIYQAAPQQAFQHPQAYWQDWALRLQQAELKIQLLTERMADLQKQVDEAKSRPPMNVEYHFDQLKINRLEGTLNVGLSPQGVQGIESLETPDASCWKVTTEQADEAAEPIRELQGEMLSYMDSQAPRLLSDMLERFGIALDEAHRAQVIEDVKRQLGERVHYYARKEEYPPKDKEEERRAWRENVKRKTIRDIQGAFSAYLAKRQHSDATGGTERP